MHEEDERPQNETSLAYHLALLTTDVNFAYWPLLQFLNSPNAYLKYGVCKSVVSFTLGPVLVIAIEIVRYCTKMNTKDAKHKKLLNLLCIVYFVLVHEHPYQSMASHLHINSLKLNLNFKPRHENIKPRFENFKPILGLKENVYINP